MEFEAAAVSISRQVLAKYITPGCTFIETGTRWGDTCLCAAELGAAHVLSVESDPLMQAIAMRHLRDGMAKHPSCIWSVSLGDSAEWLMLFRQVHASPIVMFLDAHTESVSYLLDELVSIQNWPAQLCPARILIDDRRLWSGWRIEESVVKQLCVNMGATDWVLEDGAMHPNDIAVAVWK